MPKRADSKCRTTFCKNWSTHGHDKNQNKDDLCDLIKIKKRNHKLHCIVHVQYTSPSPHWALAIRTPVGLQSSGLCNGASAPELQCSSPHSQHWTKCVGVCVCGCVGKCVRYISSPSSCPPPHIQHHHMWRYFPTSNRFTNTTYIPWIKMYKI